MLLTLHLPLPLLVQQPVLHLLVERRKAQLIYFLWRSAVFGELAYEIRNVVIANTWGISWRIVFSSWTFADDSQLSALVLVYVILSGANNSSNCLTEVHSV